ncbi:MAG: hypothetical protein EAZ40_15805 [Rhodobacterales bacterium]|nr:MAG: hypothetical protein EAZ40_15805 [Rhodobacterales bacterium]
MRIRVNTPDRLVITDRPIVLAVMLGAVLLAMIGFALAAAAAGAWVGAAILLFGAAVIGGITAVFIRRSDLILDRPSGQAHLHSSTLLGKTWHSWPLAEVTGAIVQSNHGGEDSGMTYRPALLLSGGRAQELTPVYTSGKGAARAVAAIEGWLTDPALPP